MRSSCLPNGLNDIEIKKISDRRKCTDLESPVESCDDYINNCMPRDLTFNNPKGKEITRYCSYQNTALFYLK